MRVGTKSVLFGAHCFFVHPWFVARAWWKLYGFPWDPRLWVAFFVHDLGYWGKPNMDGEEGERHPEWGARLMSRLFDRVRHHIVALYGHPGVSTDRFADLYLGSWGQLALFHSRYYAKQWRQRPSRLCYADKLSIVMTPWWLYLPMTRATGELAEYMSLGKWAKANEPNHADIDSDDARIWYAALQAYMRRWVAEHYRGDKADRWTGARPSGVDSRTPAVLD